MNVEYWGFGCFIYPMNLDEFVHRFEVAIEAVDPGTLSAKINYKALKVWDSLAVLTVTDAVETEYGVLLKKKHFERAETIEDLYRLVNEKLAPFKK